MHDAAIQRDVLFVPKVLQQHESYRCHVLASPMTLLRGGSQHVLLLSSSALHILQPEHSLPLLTLAIHQIERLEVSSAALCPNLVSSCILLPKQSFCLFALKGASTYTANLVRDGRSALTIFLHAVEAHRLGIPSCVQYSLTADAANLFTSIHEQIQLALAATQEPSCLCELGIIAHNDHYP